VCGSGDRSMLGECSTSEPHPSPQIAVEWLFYSCCTPGCLLGDRPIHWGCLPTLSPQLPDDPPLSTENVTRPCHCTLEDKVTSRKEGCGCAIIHNGFTHSLLKAINIFATLQFNEAINKTCTHFVIDSFNKYFKYTFCEHLISTNKLSKLTENFHHIN
jgi:hypothetical protein